jgi:hypothetical protein
VLIRTWRTVREVTADCPRGAGEPGCSSCSCEFLSAFLSILFVGGFLVHEVCGRSILECRKVHDEADGPRVHQDGPFFSVHY